MLELRASEAWGTVAGCIFGRRNICFAQAAACGARGAVLGVGTVSAQ